MLKLREKSRIQIWTLSAILMVILSSLIGCSDQSRPVDTLTTHEESEVSFSILLSKLAQTEMTRAEVVITAVDMETIQQELTLSGDLVSGTVQGVPVGTERLITLNGYDGAGTLIYTGSSEVDLPAGGAVPVTVAMHRVPSSSGPEPELTVTLTDPNLFFLPDMKVEFLWIEPGTFNMGSPLYEEGRDDDEGPVHEVTISQGFYLGKYEMTQQQWYAVMGVRPWEGEDNVQSGDRNPGVYISWEDVQEFIGKLNGYEGETVYRLPTEAEWEYACRAGTDTRWSFGDDENKLGKYQWHTMNGEEFAHSVGTKLPNSWGLYDMHGNVYEWCQDWHGDYSSSAQTDPIGPSTGSVRVLRGGLYPHYVQPARSANRHSDLPGFRHYYVGFRLLRTP